MTLWTEGCQAPLSMGFSREQYGMGLPCAPSGDFPDPGIEPASLASPALAGGFFTTSATWKAQQTCLKEVKIVILKQFDFTQEIKELKLILLNTHQ